MDPHSPSSEEIRKATVDHLARLLGLCRQSAAAYHVATDDIRDLELKSLFARLARERGEFADELELALKRLGAPRDSAVARRGPAALRIALAKNDAHAVLFECERAEDGALLAYQEVLESDRLDGVHRILVEKQAAAMQSAHDEIHGLRDHPAYAPQS